MAITLREITRENYRQVGKLKVADDQNTFVASNPWSMAQAKYEPGLVPLGIYDGDEPVGFAMYGEEDYGLARLWAIWRLMVDQRYQGKGYGRAAMHLLIERLKAESNGHTGIIISFVPENDAARKLYTSLGFEDTGLIEDGECVFRLPLGRQ